MFQFHAAVGKISDGLRMRHYKNGVPGFMQFVKQFQDHGLVRFVEIARGLVGQNQFRLIDQRPGDGDALLLAAGKLRGDVLKRSLRPTRHRASAASFSSVML